MPLFKECRKVEGDVMNNAIEIQNKQDLAFFGKINASISHELKNILAIISETAGLLNDLTVLAEKGKKIDLNMFKTCSQDIEEEIQRGFATVKQMNIFSHSVDTSLKSVNPLDVLKLMINIAGFLSYASKIRVNPPQDAAPMILTCPFQLQHLIYQALVYAFKATGPGGEIQISLYQEKNGDVRITFSDLGELYDGKFPADEIFALAASIDAKVFITDDFQSFDILLPETIKTVK
jgi:signal transduction histidine kinase